MKEVGFPVLLLFPGSKAPILYHCYAEQFFGTTLTFSEKRKYTALGVVDRIRCLKNSTEINV
jgi:hypothetical protein